MLSVGSVPLPHYFTSKFSLIIIHYRKKKCNTLRRKTCKTTKYTGYETSWTTEITVMSVEHFTILKIKGLAYYIIARRDWPCRNVAIRWKASLFGWALPRDCHVGRNSRLPRNDIKYDFASTFFFYKYFIWSIVIKSFDLEGRVDFLPFPKGGAELLPHSDIGA